MRPHLLVSALLLSLLAALAPARAAERLSGPVAGLVTQVIDGDTLEVRVLVWLDQEVVTRVRIDGIDTPEKRGKCQREKDMAEQARQLTETLLAEPGVTLHDIQHDKYGGRVRARVLTRSGRDVGEQLIAAGLARPYGGKARQTWCSVAQLP
ncbi:thermonuclease family protein [Skermanella mucosa]|uniref:thermonuclease family protein n=1 Tax=Skermanella mucosa TaxID=1789672 RepID=UPI001E2C2624|nr:thermonuclease family protein [Skermanella mucosa]UEM20919.1 thermonuclease family protein [Skermanella mucosa]